MSEKVKGYISELFIEMNTEVIEIVRNAPSLSVATHNIMEYVSTKIAASSQGYIVDLYSELSRKTLTEAIFQEPANANRFYELNMMQRISDAYHFDVQDLSAYGAGVDFKEINQVYAAAGAAVGSAAVGGILVGVLSGVVEIPIVVIIAGAILSGLAGGAACAKVVPEKNKANFMKAVTSFMSDLEKELFNWVNEVVKFYNQQVEELKRNLTR